MQRNRLRILLFGLAALVAGGTAALVTDAALPESSSPDTSPAASVTATTSTTGFDISGPCDEAEHANDPRCTGVTVPGADGDNSGPGSANSGPGSANSGHDGDDDSDNSGSGSDDDDSNDSDDDSGHGGDDD